MKKCPQCGREYDVSMSFCLDDGAELLYGPASMDESATAILPGVDLPSEAGTAILRSSDQYTGRSDEGFWVAVLPFKYRGDNDDLTELAAALSEDIVTALSHFTYLRVLASSSTFRFASDGMESRGAAKTLNARYLLEGNLRQMGSLLRIGVRLIDSATRATLWAENYDRQFTGDIMLFDLQEGIVSRIVSTLADPYGVLPRTMRLAVRDKAPEEMSPYDALLRSFIYAEGVTAEEHAEAKSGLEWAVRQAPNDSDCWAMLSIVLADEYGHGLGADLETLDKALAAARRAVDANPSNHRAQQALAWVLFLRKEFAPCRVAGDRATALNPMDACTSAYVGQTVAFSGDWDQGCALIARAVTLNPNHPGWYWYAVFLNAYRKHEYEEAQAVALKMNLPGVSLGYVALAAAHAQAGEGTGAKAAVRQLLELRPDYPQMARLELSKWFDTEIVEHLIDGLRKAGLDVTNNEGQVV